jgi:hypothetical protein
MGIVGKNRASKIINRNNTCGGNKKCGLIPRIGKAGSGVMRAALRRGTTRQMWDGLTCAQAIEKGYPLSKNPQGSGGIGRMYLFR